MWFQSWLDTVRILAEGQRSLPKQQSTDRRGRPTRRLLVEGLEDRRLLTFLPAVSYPAGASPLAMVAADFNGDGHLDLATANPVAESPYESGTVSVLFGDGAGGFGAAIKSTLGTYGVNRGFLTAADFDNDGHGDLAFAVYNSETFDAGRVGVLLSNGDGTFQSPTVVPTIGPWWLPLAVAAGDFNNDGNSDLVVNADEGDFSTGAVWVALGNGQGGFTQPGYVRGGPHDGGLAVGDLNGDGNLDAVGIELGGGGSAYLGNGAALLLKADAFYSSGVPRAVAVGDFTSDGIPDLVVSGWGVEIFTGLGDGTFDEPIVRSANGYEHTGVAVADFNGDGLLDAVTSDRYEGAVSELPGNGNGTLTYAGAYAVGLSPSAIAVGDFNGDGRPDVATADAGSNTVSVLLNDGDWTPPPPPPPTVRIGDATVTEGNTGAVAAVFTVTLSADSSQPVTVAYATGDGSASAGSDYQAASGTLTFAPGQTSRTLTVLVNGDRSGEPNETFVVNLSSPTNATIADSRSIGAITDDEPRVSISDVAKAEGKKGKTTLFTFTVTLSAAYDQAVTVSYRTANGTATTTGSDYIAKSGTLTFAPGETTKTITIEVTGDSKREANETFYLDLFGNSSNSRFKKNRGIGTILNDD